MQLIADNLAGERGAMRLFEGVSFTLSAGEGMVVTGPNGAGKSTLLRILAGFLDAADGNARVDGNPIHASSHYLGPLNGMKPALTVMENLDFWRELYGGKHSVGAALSRLNVDHTQSARFSDLSTGQKRRVAIARLLTAHRPIWILDEPTSGLDKAGEATFAEIVSDHLTDGGIVIAATHLPIDVEGMKRLHFSGQTQ